MIFILIGLLVVGFYCLLAFLLRVPNFNANSLLNPTGAKTTLLGNVKKQVTSSLLPFLKMNPEKVARKNRTLYLAGINETAQEHTLFIFVKLVLCFSAGLPLYFFLGNIAATFVLGMLLAYFSILKREKKIAKLAEENREKLEREIPQFVSYVGTQLLTTKNILHIFSGYVKNYSTPFSEQLIVTIADIKTGGLEVALGRMEQRLHSILITEIISALLAACRGNDMTLTFQKISEKVEALWNEKLHAQALKKKNRMNRRSIVICVMGFAIILFAFGTVFMDSSSALL